MILNEHELKFVLSYKLIFFFFFLFTSLSGLISFFIYSFQRDFETFKQTVIQNNIENSIIIKELRDENLLQAKKISQLEQEIVSNSCATANVDLVPNPDILTLCIYCFVVIATLITFYFMYDVFLKKTFLSKIILGTNTFLYSIFTKITENFGTHHKIYEIYFPDYSFDLRLTFNSGNTCSVSCKFKSEDVYTPFEYFLKRFDKNTMDLSKVQEALKSGDPSFIVESLSAAAASNPEVLYGSMTVQQIVEIL